MKNQKRGFIVPLLLTVIVILIIGGWVYMYENKKAETPTLPSDVGTELQTNTQNHSATTQQDNSVSSNKVTTQPKQNTPSLITVLSPKTNDTLVAGQTYTIKWASENLGNQVVFITLLSEKNTLVSSIAEGTKNNGSYTWKIETAIPKGNYQIVVSTSENLPTGENTASGKSGMFLINSNTSVPKTPNITSIYYSPTRHSSGGSYAWSNTTIYGDNFLSQDKAYLVNSSTGVDMLELTIDGPTGTPSSSTQFVVQIPSSVAPGTYSIVVKDSIFDSKSQPHTFTITSQ